MPPTQEMWDAYFRQQKIDDPERFGAIETNVYDDIAAKARKDAGLDDESQGTPQNDGAPPEHSSLDDLSSQDTAAKEAQADQMRDRLKAKAEAGGRESHGLFGMMQDAPAGARDDDDDEEAEEEEGGVVEEWMSRYATDVLAAYRDDETTEKLDMLHEEYKAMIDDHWNNVCEDDSLPFIVREDMKVLDLRKVVWMHMKAAYDVEEFLNVCARRRPEAGTRLCPHVCSSQARNSSSTTRRTRSTTRATPRAAPRPRNGTGIPARRCRRGNGRPRASWATTQTSTTTATEVRRNGSRRRRHKKRITHDALPAAAPPRAPSGAGLPMLTSFASGCEPPSRR